MPNQPTPWSQYTNPKRRVYRAQYNKRYYARTLFRRKPGKESYWTKDEDDQVLAHRVPDRELADKLNRSVGSIQLRRSRLKGLTEW